MGQVFYHCATAAWFEKFKDIHSLPLLVFSGRFCSYQKPNFPAVSGSYLQPYLQLLAAEFSGRIR